MKNKRAAGTESTDAGNSSNDTSSAYTKSPRRTFVDVVRKGGKRRGYITVRRRDDGQLEVGFSLCELKDRFSGTTGLNIAFKRGERMVSRHAYVIPPDTVVIGSGGDSATAVPRTMLSRILKDAEKSEEIFGEYGDVVLPEWVNDLRTGNCGFIQHWVFVHPEGTTPITVG
jgi:hypothetical protein